MQKKQPGDFHIEVINERDDERDDEETVIMEEENGGNENDMYIYRITNQYKELIQKLEEEIDSLKCQLEASRNEIRFMEADQQQELQQKNFELSAVRTALQNSNEELQNLKQKNSNDEGELKEFRAFKCSMERERNEDNDFAHNSNEMSSSSTINFENDARLISLISTFLNVHPFGANIHYICSFLHETHPTIQVRDVENVMKRFPTIYKEEVFGIGATLEKKWQYIGFQPSDRSNL